MNTEEASKQFTSLVNELLKKNQEKAMSCADEENLRAAFCCEMCEDWPRLLSQSRLSAADYQDCIARRRYISTATVRVNLNRLYKRIEYAIECVHELKAFPVRNGQLVTLASFLIGQQRAKFMRDMSDIKFDNIHEFDNSPLVELVDVFVHLVQKL